MKSYTMVECKAAVAIIIKLWGCLSERATAGTLDTQGTANHIP